MIENLMLHGLFEKAFLRCLEKTHYGQVTVYTPQGRSRSFTGSQSGPVADLAIHDNRVYSAIMLHGDIGLAESYRDGLWSSSDLALLCEFGLINQEALEEIVLGSSLSRFLRVFSYALLRGNSISGSKRNISAHYDLGNDFYKLWLDPSMTYSSAIYGDSDAGLEVAQQNKYDRILSCLDSRPQNVLEIGCGWGGFAERSVNKADHRMTCLTISESQHRYAQDRLRSFGDRSEVRLEDYRKTAGVFDAIVSIEMFEAVGEKYWSTYFQKISQLLKPKGVAVIQTITIKDDYFETYRKGGDAIREFIFPGGMLPSLSRFEESARCAGLRLGEHFSFGGDYARTLSCWLRNFDAQKQRILDLGYSEDFYRLWRYYLASCTAAFRSGRTDVVQVELAHG